MPLSEQEKRLLEQMEAALAADDPKLANTLRGPSVKRTIHRRRATLAGVGFFLGLALLLGGLQVNPLISVAGFVAMLTATIVALSSWQHINDGEPAKPRSRDAPTPTGKGSRQGFMDRMEDRWRRRQDGDH